MTKNGLARLTIDDLVLQYSPKTSNTTNCMQGGFREYSAKIKESLMDGRFGTPADKSVKFKQYTI